MAFDQKIDIPLGRVKNGCRVFPSPPCMFITAAMDIGRAFSECRSPCKQDSRCTCSSSNTLNSFEVRRVLRQEGASAAIARSRIGPGARKLNESSRQAPRTDLQALAGAEKFY